jgi:hypothetical protein
MKNVWTNYGYPYPGEYPQEPYKPHEPKRESYVGRGAKEGKCIYADSEILDEAYEERLDEEEEEDRPPKASKSLNDNLTLQDILDLAPPGTNPKDIVINLSYPRYVNYITLSFNHVKRNLEAEEKAYQRDLKQYQCDLAVYNEKYAQYQKDKEAYEKWVNEQEIKQLEEKLAKLKK